MGDQIWHWLAAQKATCAQMSLSQMYFDKLEQINREADRQTDRWHHCLKYEKRFFAKENLVCFSFSS